MRVGFRFAAAQTCADGIGLAAEENEQCPATHVASVSAEPRATLYSPGAIDKLAAVNRRLEALGLKGSACSLRRLISDLDEAKEQHQFNQAMIAEAALEKEILAETENLLILQAQRHAVELPRALRSHQ